MMDLHNNGEGRTAAAEGGVVDPDRLQKAPAKTTQVIPYGAGE